MKVSIAVIKLVLRTNKVLADGSHPIMLRVSFNGRHLVDWFQKINEEIARRNVVNEDNIPLIDLDCRYYSYRHSFIMKELQKPTVNLLALAQTVGKSATTLHQYISLLGDVDLV